MNGAFVHVAVFGIGAAVGAGVASTILDKRRAVTVVPSTPSPVVVESPGTNGVFTLPTRELQLSGEVLKYGNPGKCADCCLSYHHPKSLRH